MTQMSRWVSRTVGSPFPLSLGPCKKMPSLPLREKVAEQISFLLCRWRGQVTGRLHTCSTFWAMADPQAL